MDCTSSLLEEPIYSFWEKFNAERGQFVIGRVYNMLCCRLHVNLQSILHREQQKEANMIKLKHFSTILTAATLSLKAGWVA